ncbi:BON domain-containing protein [Aeromicrobium sp.]|uniref:BON domain-containing protein n=1 Tax=Aeromicrobium sp. TaxID=1871063 RepID=UPI002FCBD725
MKPTTTRNTDHVIQEDVIEELAWSPDVNDSRIGVSVLDGAVTLSGEVDSHAERNAAVRAALRVTGVSVVADDLEVRRTVKSGQTDTDIAAAIRTVLKWTSKVPGDSVQVEVRDHVAILTGTVTYQFQRREAEKLVGGVTGVTHVENRIELSPRASAEDTQNRIERALVRSATTDANAIRVTVVGREVTLTGTVRTWLERSEAGRAAWSSPNVSAVHNKIKVSP